MFNKKLKKIVAVACIIFSSTSLISCFSIDVDKNSNPYTLEPYDLKPVDNDDIATEVSE